MFDDVEVQEIVQQIAIPICPNDGCGMDRNPAGAWMCDCCGLVLTELKAPDIRAHAVPESAPPEEPQPVKGKRRR